MILSTRGVLCAAVSLILPLSCAFARAPQVRDHAGICTASALKDANAIIAAIYSDYDVSVFVETTTGTPSRSFRETIRRTWQRFFPTHGAPSSLSEHGDRTIYVRIARDPSPGTVQIQVGPDPQLQSAFPGSARVMLRELLLASLKQSTTQAGFTDGLKLIRQTLTTNLGAPFDWGIALTVVASLLAAWVGLESLRVFFRARQTEDPSSSLAGAGGFGPALFAMMINRDYRRFWRAGIERPTQSLADRSQSEAVS